MEKTIKKDDLDAHILKLWKSSNSTLRPTLNNEQELQVSRTAVLLSKWILPSIGISYMQTQTDKGLYAHEKEREREPPGGI